MSGQDAILAALSKRQRKLVDQREHCVRLWQWAMRFGKDCGLRQDQVTPHLIAFLKSLGFEVSRATIMRWNRAYCHDGVMGLIDQRGMRGRMKQFGMFFLALERMYTGPGLHSEELCHELAREDAKLFGYPIPAFRDSKRYLKKYIQPGLRAGRWGVVEGRSNGASTGI